MTKHQQDRLSRLRVPLSLWGGRKSRADRNVSASRSNILKRENGPGLWPWFTLLSGVLVLVAGAIVPNPLDSFPIVSVEVKGEFTHVHQQEIEYVMAGLVSGVNYFDVPLKKVKQKLDSLPWVDLSTVEKQWPGVLVVTVREKQALAFWNDNHVISHQGEVFTPNEIPVVDILPRLYGSAGDESLVMEMFHQMSVMLRSVDLYPVYLKRNLRKGWELGLQNGVTIKCDRNKPFEKLKNFVELYRSMTPEEQMQVETVDLRYGSGIAVKWQETNPRLSS